VTTSSTFVSWPLMRIHILLPGPGRHARGCRPGTGPVEATISFVVVGCRVRGDVWVRMAFRKLTVIHTADTEPIQ
jgi:hypothetical protein